MFSRVVSYCIVSYCIRNVLLYIVLHYCQDSSLSQTSVLSANWKIVESGKFVNPIFFCHSLSKVFTFSHTIVYRNSTLQLQESRLDGRCLVKDEQ